MNSKNNRFYENKFKKRKNYFFDIGCSRYIDATSWFYNTYWLNGLRLNHVFGWEAKNMSAQQYFQHVPRERWHETSFYNYFASSKIGDVKNPLTKVLVLTTI